LLRCAQSDAKRSSKNNKKNAAKEHKGLKDSKLWKTDFSEIYAFFSAKNLPKFGKRIPTGLQDREIEILSLLLSRQKNIN